MSTAWVWLCIWYRYHIYNIFYTKTRSIIILIMFVKYNIYYSIDTFCRMLQFFNHNQEPMYSFRWLNHWELIRNTRFASGDNHISSDSNYIKQVFSFMKCNKKNALRIKCWIVFLIPMLCVSNFTLRGLSIQVKIYNDIVSYLRLNKLLFDKFCR